MPYTKRLGVEHVSTHSGLLGRSDRLDLYRPVCMGGDDMKSIKVSIDLNESTIELLKKDLTDLPRFSASRVLILELIELWDESQ